MGSVEMENKGEQEEVVGKGGELLFCGPTAWAKVRVKGSREGNLVTPTRFRSLMGINIRYVASGCVSCHCVALDMEGRCYIWGRNEKGQLGLGDTIQRDKPSVVSELSKHKIIRAGAGRSHTVVVTEDGLSLAFGWNKHGQLGSGSIKNEVEPSPVQCLVSEAKTTACGGDFTLWLTPVEGASILTAGLPQYGQLGHGTDKEYNTKDSSVRLAYEAQPNPQTIASVAEETIVKIDCGTNHTVAVDKTGYVYTLGHREQKDEWVPRRVDVFTKHNILPPDAIVSAGSVNSSCTAGGGQVYMCGKMKVSGDDWMYPKPLMDLRYNLPTWIVPFLQRLALNCMDSGNMHHFVGADSSCISWGHAQSGELGYGPKGQKSSANPKKVEILEGMHVFSQFFRLVLLVDMPTPWWLWIELMFADRLEQLEVYDGKAGSEAVNEPDNGTYVPEKSTRKSSAKKSESFKKRKNSESESDSEDEENSDNESEGELNGQAKHRKISGGKATGERRGPNTGGKGSGKRGRPGKSRASVS
ncbi:Hypothetical predicted protein [Olea europaea subsp. europaea]|uniref:Uncharacterized protein n=1 Tax=Olea europaea subsp. europaea TaxID=158383 RepID=A0A8S0VPQ1_OLEEU|nr:Hypothetical predicted protein [Olea europaea subsp. europaea]